VDRVDLSRSEPRLRVRKLLAAIPGSNSLEELDPRDFETSNQLARRRKVNQMRKSIAGIALVLISTSVRAELYEIKREAEGPFKFKLFGVELNEGSSLQRESVLFNDPSCPVQITRNRMVFAYADRRMTLSAATQLTMRQPIMAMEVRHILFDVCGQDARNVSNLAASDFQAVPANLPSTWNIFDENDASELLTTVTYIARVRFVDGTQWVVNSDNLSQALGSLHLERKIEDENPPKEAP